MSVEKTQLKKAAVVEVGARIQQRLDTFDMTQAKLMGEVSGFGKAEQAVKAIFDHLYKARDAGEYSQEQTVEIAKWVRRCFHVVESLHLTGKDTVQRNLGKRAGLEIAMQEVARYAALMERKMVQEEEAPPTAPAKPDLHVVGAHPGSAAEVREKARAASKAKKAKKAAPKAKKAAPKAKPKDD